jgi:hypothetical protein
VLSDDLTTLQGVLEGVQNPEGERPIQRVFRNPRSQTVVTAELPCLLLFCRKPSIIEAFSFGVEKRTSEIVCQFIYSPVGQGINEDTYFSILSYGEAIMDTIWSNLQLADTEGNPQVNWVLPKSAGVPGTLPEKWGGQVFVGVDILLTLVASRAI